MRSTERRSEFDGTVACPAALEEGARAWPLLMGGTQPEVLRAERRGARRILERRVRVRTDAGYGRRLRLGEFGREECDTGGTIPSA